MEILDIRYQNRYKNRYKYNTKMSNKDYLLSYEKFNLY